MSLFIWPPIQANIDATGVATESTLASIKGTVETMALDVDAIAHATPGNLLKGIIFDYIGVDESDSLTNVYTYLEGGSGGTLKRTITVTFTDTNKSVMQSIAATDPA